MIPMTLTPDNTALVLIDFNAGLMAILPPERRAVVREGAIALSKIGALFALPTIILGKGAEDDFGPLLPEVVERHAAAPHPVRHTLSAWNEPSFVAAVEATGRKIFVLAGVATDLCVALTALDLRRSGYDVVLVADASGSQDPIAEQAGMMRLDAAGCSMTSWVGLAGELMRDWTLPQAGAMRQIYAEHIPAVVAAHAQSGAGTQHRR